jgi:hypothetical protein
VRFDDVTTDWIASSRKAAVEAALRAARLAAAERLLSGPAAGHRLTAVEAVDVLLARDNTDPTYDVLQPYESRWAVLVVRIVLGTDVAGDAVSDARARGTTWATIGEALGGLSPQAVQQRFGKSRGEP